MAEGGSLLERLAQLNALPRSGDYTPPKWIEEHGREAHRLAQENRERLIKEIVRGLPTNLPKAIHGASREVAGVGTSLAGIPGDVAELLGAKGKLGALPTGRMLDDNFSDLYMSHEQREDPVFRGGQNATDAAYAAALPKSAMAGARWLLTHPKTVGAGAAVAPSAAGSDQGYADGGLTRVMKMIQAAKRGAAAPERATTVVKERGGNWLPTEHSNLGEYLNELAYNGHAPAGMEHIPPPQQPIPKWVNGQLRKYIQNDLSTPTDPLRELARKGELHLTPEQLLHMNENAGPPPTLSMTGGNAKTARNVAREANIAAGRPPLTGYATNDMRGILPSEVERDPGMQWAALADHAVKAAHPTLAQQNLEEILSNGTRTNLEIRNAAKAALPWEKLKGDVHDVSEGDVHALGLDHIVDYLHQLPPHEQAKLERMSVPDVVRKVSAWNKDLAAKMADQQSALSKSFPVHKEYPDGFRWVKLEKPKDVPEGQDASKMLQDALSGEGNAMGHCVGSYCDDVASGRSGIYSLRDAKGQPHVTIETRGKYHDPRFEIPDEHMDQIGKQARQEAKAKGLKDDSEDYMHYVMEREQALSDEWAAKNPIVYPNIAQIKGKQNAAPHDDYVPYVQDFIRSQPWGRVQELRNAKMYDSSVLNDSHATTKHLREKIGDAPYYTESDLDDATIKALGEGHADGGLIHDTIMRAAHKRALQ